jgi:hypothetical protein
VRHVALEMRRPIPANNGCKRELVPRLTSMMMSFASSEFDTPWYLSPALSLARLFKGKWSLAVRRAAPIGELHVVEKNKSSSQPRHEGV